MKTRPGRPPRKEKTRRSSFLKPIFALTVLSVFACAAAACGAGAPDETGTAEQTAQEATTAERERAFVKTLEGVTASDYYRNGFTSNYVTGADAFGRSFGASAGEKTDKDRDVGIFYFCWLGQHGGTKIYDVSKILESENGLDVMFRQDGPDAPAGQNYFWGEPLYGYYNSKDSWVIRRHLALFTLAGIDFIVFDTTNAVTYDAVVDNVIAEAKKMAKAGWKVPGLAFYTNSYSHNVINSLYNKYYKDGKYSGVWYYLDGKPLIIGNVSVEADVSEARSRGDTAYSPAEFSSEIRSFFTFRDSQWPDKPMIDNGFPWIEWSYPAPVHNGVMNVAVASHPALPMSFSLTRGALNWGRGWNVETKRNETDGILEGRFFQLTWDAALRADPDVVFVTGWNEWVATKFAYAGEYALVDQCNLEFSRDAEMMKGGYGDAFYIQLAKNVRDYKTVAIPDDVQLEPSTLTVPMTDDLSVWEGVEAVFRDPIVVNTSRYSAGAVPSLLYTTPARRNNVEEIRVAQDDDCFYFMFKASKNIRAREDGDTAWMNLFLSAAGSAGGWEGFGFVIGRADAGDGRLTVEKLNPDFTSEKIGEAEYRIDGRVMQLKIPREAIGVPAGDNRLDFKLADGVENPSDVMDYYCTGLSFPLGRLRCRYLG
ncbi:MAG: hypothetical protein ILO42_00300 [Clostridia bacterium]|nr:hypothetical protein [Clostridia bacterium]